MLLMNEEGGGYGCIVLNIKMVEEEWCFGSSIGKYEWY